MNHQQYQPSGFGQGFPGVPGVATFPAQQPTFQPQQPQNQSSNFHNRRRSAAATDATIPRLCTANAYANATSAGPADTMASAADDAVSATTTGSSTNVAASAASAALLTASNAADGAQQYTSYHADAIKQPA